MEFPTNQIDCCRVTPLGESCGIPDPANFDVYGGTNVIQTLSLVLSNLLLVHASYKAFYMKLYDYSTITLIAAIISGLYHLCKALEGGGNVCVLPFCFLKTLDYASSTTTLLRTILHIALPVSHYVRKKNSGHMVRKWAKYIKRQQEIFISFVYITIIVMFQSTSFCSGRDTLWLFLFTIGLTVIFMLFALFALTSFGENIRTVYLNANYQWKTLLVGLLFGAVALVLFFVEDVTKVDTYWYTHSLWHNFAAISQTILIDIRTARMGIQWIIFCQSCTGIETE